jgi:CRISPR-associated protein Csy2
MTLTYLLIPRLQVQGANAQATWWLVNSTPVMACTMFGHALGRHLNQPATGVAILHHATQLHGEQFGYFRPEQRRGAVFIDKVDYSSKNKHALSLQPTATFSGEFSLIVRFGEMAEVSLAKVEEFLLRARLAGGQIIEHGQCRMTTPKELSQHVRSGYWLIDRRDLMRKADGEDWLDVLLRVTAQPDWRKRADAASPVASGNEDDGVDHEDEEDPWQFTATRTPLPASWMVATNLGYALLTSVVPRAGAREGYPHAFAEPLVGPVQYVSVRQFGDRPLPVWQPGWPRDDVFLLSQPDLEI